MSLPASLLRALKSYKDETKTFEPKTDANIASLFKPVPDNVQEDYSHINRRKTILELVLLSCAVCGIEFCYAAETAFVSPKLLKIGIPVAFMTFVWGVSPAIGFLMVPIFGSMSDRCGLKLGRRRPFIILMSVGIVLGLVLVPNGKTIGLFLGDTYGNHHLNNIGDSIMDINTSYNESKQENNKTVPLNITYQPRNNSIMFNSTASSMKPQNSVSHNGWGILFTVLGVVLLDLNCDACQSPCRTYLLDVSIPEDHNRGLSIFTVMAGFGGSMGYLLGAINWEHTNFGESLGGHVRVVFTLVLVIYIVCGLLTVTSIKEIPLHKLGVTNEELQKHKKVKTGKKYRKFVNEDTSSEEEYTNVKPESNKEEYGAITDNQKSQYIEQYDNKIKENGCIQEYNKEISTNQEHLTDIKCYEMDQDNKLLPTEVSLKTYLKSILHMPKSLVILCITNLFCWMSLVCYSLYFTDFVGQAVYGGNPNAPDDDGSRELYESGVRWGSLGMSLYSASCSAYSLCIGKLVRSIGAKPVYICSQLVYTVGALIMALSKSRATVLLLSPTVGIMYATLFTMPYFLVAHYHSTNTFTEDCGEKTKQIRGLGTDVATVSSMVFVAQFMLSLVMGAIIHAVGTTAVVMYMASLLSLCGAIAATQVLYLGI